MKFIVVDSPRDVDLFGAAEVAKQLLSKLNSSFSFAGGNTTKSFHSTVVEISKYLKLDFSSAVGFTLDEYLGVSSDRPESVSWRINDQLFKHLNFRPKNIHMLDSMTDQPDKACSDFENLLNNIGIDLQVLSIGTNGHIAFNEPGTPFGTVSRIVNLSEHTIETKSPMFGGIDKMPRQGITVGIKSIMNAKNILFLAKGVEKAEVVKKTLYGDVTESLPASVLQLHPNLTVVIDKEAASAL